MRRDGDFTPLQDWDDILARRTPFLSHRGLRATDCRVLAPFADDNAILFVSSPNMTFIPEIPLYKPGDPIYYYGDGMLLWFEFMKWPQADYEPEPHCVAAPLHPRLCALGISEERGLGPDFPLEDDESALPKFTDDDIAWTVFTQHDVVLHQRHTRYTVASIRTPFAARLAAALDEAVAMASEGMDVRLDHAGM